LNIYILKARRGCNIFYQCTNIARILNPDTEAFSR